MILCQTLEISNLQKLVLYKPEIDKSGSIVNDPWPCTDVSVWEIDQQMHIQICNSTVLQTA